MRIINYLFICSQLILISNAQTYNPEYEEAKLSIKMENWSNIDTPITSYFFELGEKLFDSNFNWNISGVNYEDFFGLTAIHISDKTEVTIPGRFLQASGAVLSCTDGSIKGTFDSQVENFWGISVAFYNTELEQYVCPDDTIRFSINFRLYKDDTLMYGNMGVLSNEVPLIETSNILPNNSFVNAEFSVGQDEWGLSTKWKFTGTNGDDYKMTLISTNIPLGNAYGFGWLDISSENSGLRYHWNLMEYRIGTSVNFSQLLKNKDGKFPSNKAIIKVELYWQTFGQNARFGDYVQQSKDNKVIEITNSIQKIQKYV